MSAASEYHFQNGQFALVGRVQTLASLRQERNGVELVDYFLIEEIDIDCAVQQHIYNRSGIIRRARNSENG